MQSCVTARPGLIAGGLLGYHILKGNTSCKEEEQVCMKFGFRHAESLGPSSGEAQQDVPGGIS